MIRGGGGGEELEAIIKKQSHYREAAATAPSESTIPLGHVWCAQTTGHCQYLPCIINPPNSFFLARNDWFLKPDGNHHSGDRAVLPCCWTISNDI